MAITPAELRALTTASEEELRGLETAIDEQFKQTWDGESAKAVIPGTIHPAVYAVLYKRYEEHWTFQKTQGPKNTSIVASDRGEGNEGFPSKGDPFEETL